MNEPTVLDEFDRLKAQKQQMEIKQRSKELQSAIERAEKAEVRLVECAEALSNLLRACPCCIDGVIEYRQKARSVLQSCIGGGVGDQS